MHSSSNNDIVILTSDYATRSLSPLKIANFFFLGGGEGGMYVDHPTFNLSFKKKFFRKDIIKSEAFLYLG